MWSNQDPREVLDYTKGRQIIIWRRQGLFGDVFIGQVWTKNDWDIQISSNHIRSIYSDDKWDPDWYWCLPPE
jgi:hypothetical protein